MGLRMPSKPDCPVRPSACFQARDPGGLLSWCGDRKYWLNSRMIRSTTARQTTPARRSVYIDVDEPPEVVNQGRGVHGVREPTQPCAASRQARWHDGSRGGPTGDLTLHKRQIRTADAGGLTGRPHIRHAGPLVRVDPNDRLYVSDINGFSVYDTSGASGFTRLARRDGLGYLRFGLDALSDRVRVFFVPFRGSGVVGRFDLNL